MEYTFPSAVSLDKVREILPYSAVLLENAEKGILVGMGVDYATARTIYSYKKQRVEVKPIITDSEKSLIGKLEITADDATLEAKFAELITKAHKKMTASSTSGAEFQRDLADSASSPCDKV